MSGFFRFKPGGSDSSLEGQIQACSLDLSLEAEMEAWSLRFKLGGSDSSFELRFKPGSSDSSLEPQIQAWSFRLKPGASDSTLDAQIPHLLHARALQSLQWEVQGIQDIHENQAFAASPPRGADVVINIQLATLPVVGHVDATPVEGLGGLRNHTSCVGGI